ncbi:MAG: glycoside hydrolase family 99-like domain-containing protein [Cytophagales bacterium]
MKLISYYLPQYHPIPENDEWWGKGFTEWTNVVKAQALFEGHYQPRFPKDLGYYDLRLAETREHQAQLAKEHGIYGFCYYHYWFGNGKKLLERPAQEVLNTKRPDFPFCFCWANETWKGIWFGKSGATLIEQTYPGIEDYKAHFEYLLPFFEDERYIKVEGKPLFVIYIAQNIPDLKMFTDLFRELAQKAGLNGLYLVASRWERNWNPKENGLDAVIDPSFFEARYGKALPPIKLSIQERILRKLRIVTKPVFEWNVEKRDKPLIFEYSEAVKYLISKEQYDFDCFPCVIPDWDNSARAGNKSLIFKNSTPELWEKHLREGIEKVNHLPKEKQLVFVKSWNEWAEGNYLEPDQKWGKAYLEVVKKVVFNPNNP